MDKILEDDILTVLTTCKSPEFLRKEWDRRFKYFGITEDRMKDIFITGALFGIITKQAIDFYDNEPTNGILEEITKMVLSFMGNRFHP